MGTMNHDAVIATTCNDGRFAEAVAWINLRDDQRYFFIHDTPFANSYCTIICLPDGSEEGWSESDDGNKRRAEFIAFLKSHDYDDGSNPWDFVEVSFGEFGASITATNSENKF